MKKKNPSNYNNFHTSTHYYTPPLFTKTQEYKKMTKTKGKSPSKSNDMVVTSTASNPNKWTLSSLINALPFTPSTVRRSSGGTSSATCSSNGDHGSKSKLSSSSSSVHDCDFVSRASHEFFTPTHQLASVLSSTSFRKQEQSPKRKSISTIYESTFDHQRFVVQEQRQGNVSESNTNKVSKRLVPEATPNDHELFTSTTETDRRFSYPLLPSGSKEKVCRWSENNVRKSFKVSRDKHIGATKTKQMKGEGEKPVVEDEEHASHIDHPNPGHDFSDEAQKHKQKVELDALYKACYADLLNKLKKKEAEIASWELSQRSKAELKLDRIERKLDKKKAKATQKMHQKVVDAKMEAERRKNKERKSVMKKVAKLCQKCQGYKPTTTSSMLHFPWSASGKSQYTSTATTPRGS